MIWNCKTLAVHLDFNSSLWFEFFFSPTDGVGAELSCWDATQALSSRLPTVFRHINLLKAKEFWTGAQVLLRMKFRKWFRHWEKGRQISDKSSSPSQTQDSECAKWIDFSRSSVIQRKQLCTLARARAVECGVKIEAVQCVICEQGQWIYRLRHMLRHSSSCLAGILYTWWMAMSLWHWRTAAMQADNCRKLKLYLFRKLSLEWLTPYSELICNLLAMSLKCISIQS